MVYQIDNERDLNAYVMSFSSKVGSAPSEIKYEKHPVSIQVTLPTFLSLTAFADTGNHTDSHTAHLAPTLSATGRSTSTASIHKA